LRRELDTIFDRFLDSAWGDTDGFAGDPLRMDVRESDEEVVVRAEIPGVDPKDLDIQLAGDVLVIAGEKKDEREERKAALTYSERRYGSFRRTLRLASPIDPDSVRAEHKNGVVTITLTKAESVRPKRIQVKSS
jgi:HSP20 family protein